MIVCSTGHAKRRRSPTASNQQQESCFLPSSPFSLLKSISLSSSLSFSPLLCLSSHFNDFTFPPSPSLSLSLSSLHRERERKKIRLHFSHWLIFVLPSPLLFRTDRRDEDNSPFPSSSSSSFLSSDKNRLQSRDEWICLRSPPPPPQAKTFFSLPAF